VIRNTGYEVEEAPAMIPKNTEIIPFSTARRNEHVQTIPEFFAPLAAKERY
jgi:hypothetical protein